MSTAEFDLAYVVPPSMRRRWWVFLLVGIFWSLVSLILLRFDVSSARAVGILAGIVFIAWGLEEFAMLVVMTTGGELTMSSPWKWLHGVLGLILVVAGIVALANPVNTFEAIAALIGWVLLLKGIFDLIVALSNRGVELWWTRLVLGIIELALAVAVSGDLTRKAVVLIVFVAAGTIIRGITNIMLAFQLRSLPK